MSAQIRGSLKRLTENFFIGISLSPVVHKIDKIGNHRTGASAISAEVKGECKDRFIRNVWRRYVFVSKKEGSKIEPSHCGKGSNVIFPVEAHGFPRSVDINEVRLIERQVEDRLLKEGHW